VDRDGTAWNREENEHKGGRSIFLERNTCIGFLVGVLFNHYMGRRLLFIFRSFLKALLLLLQPKVKIAIWIFTIFNKSPVQKPPRKELKVKRYAG
jgi:hypothetical protein